MNKDEIRIFIKNKFQNLNKNLLYKKSEQLKIEILKNPYVLKSKSIGFFVGGKNEIETIEIIEELLKIGKSIYLPKIVKDNKMIFTKINSLDDLSVGKFDILEPISDIESFDIELFLVPGIAFTKEGKRIGKGKGYYDQYFGTYKNNYKIGICFDFQVFDDFLVEKWDVMMDEIIIDN